MNAMNQRYEALFFRYMHLGFKVVFFVETQGREKSTGTLCTIARIVQHMYEHMCAAAAIDDTIANMVQQQ